MKLFQIEEPDGAPVDADAAGGAIGIDASGAEIVVAFAVGGNAVVLTDREGFEEIFPVPPAEADAKAWSVLLAGARLRAERALGQPVTHAVLALGGLPAGAELARELNDAGAAAGLTLLRIVPKAEIAGGEVPALAAAILAEDLAPHSALP